MQYKCPRGTKDILPPDSDLWNYISNVAHKVFEVCHYKQIITPTFEQTELFTRSIGDQTDIVEKEMYTFADRKGRSLTLRPEGTAPVVRAYLEHEMHKQNQVTKLFYSGPMYRYERPQSGRYREFHQIGAECIGSLDPIYDAEIIAMSIYLFDEMGLGELKVMLNSVGCPVCRPVIKEQLKQFLGDNINSLCDDCKRRFVDNPLRILDCKLEACQNFLAGAPGVLEVLCQECSDHFNTVQEYLDNLNVSFSINNKLVRGLDYYTKTTFEVISPNLGAHNAICGGGRYDHLIQELGGPDIPAVGFAFGVERVDMLLQQVKKLTEFERPLDVMTIMLGEETRTKGFMIVDELRRSGLLTDFSCVGRSLKSHMKLADKQRAKIVVIIGEEEFERGVALVRVMATGDQQEVAYREIETTVCRLLKSTAFVKEE